MSRDMVWTSAQGASGTGLLCEFYREEDIAHYLVHGGRVDCSKPFSSACSWADEQSQSWAPNLSQCKIPCVKEVPWHKRTHLFQCSTSGEWCWAKDLPPSSAGFAACACSLHPVVFGTTCARGLVPACPLHLIQGKRRFLRVSCPSAAGRHSDSCSWFPFAPPGLSRPLPPFLGREGCEISSLSWPHSPAIAVASRVQAPP